MFVVDILYVISDVTRHLIVVSQESVNEKKQLKEFVLHGEISKMVVEN